MSTDLKEHNTKTQKEDLYTYKPRKRKGDAKAQSKKADKKPSVQTQETTFNKKFIIIPAIIVFALILGFVAFSMTLPQNKIAKNISICGVDVGNMTFDEAVLAIDTLDFDEEEFTIVSNNKSFDISSSEFELTLDKEASVKKAFEIGKSKNIFLNAYNGIVLQFSKIDVPFVPKYNKEQLNSILFEFGTTINGVSTEAQFDYTKDSITITPATPGQNHDTSLAENQFVKAITKGQNDNIEVTLDYADVDPLDANKIYNEITKEAKGAEYVKNEDGSISVTEHSYGVKIEKSVLIDAIDKVNNGQVATVSADITIPEATKEHLEENLFTYTLGTYTTDFSSSSANRADNVKRASNSINNKILMPGEVFSYNQTIGNPSAANGYKVAPVFENGKTSQGVGGGICQVSSTLYSAVLYADLAVTERHNHSLTVGYVPKGQDATVSYGAIDFKFKNDTNYPIKVSSVVNGRKLTVSLIGGKPAVEKKVELSHNTVSTIAPTEKATEDATLAPGTRKVISAGKNGYVVDTYKTVYEDGKKVSSKKITTSRYRMVPTEVAVGVSEVLQPEIDSSVGVTLIPTDPIEQSTEQPTTEQTSPTPDVSQPIDAPTQTEQPNQTETENVSTIE